MSEVKMWTPRDLRLPAVMWESDRKRWDTTAVRRMVAPAERLSRPGGGGGGGGKEAETATAAAAAPAVISPAERGTFSVEWIGEPWRVYMAQYLTARLINSNYCNAPPHVGGGGGGGNVSLLMDPLGVGASTFLMPHVEHQVLFQDLLNATNRPGVELQSALTALAGSMVNEVVPQFNARARATVTPSVLVLTPRRSRGLVIVAAVVVANMACGLVALTTSHSARRSFWQVLSQVVSQHTAWVLECATELDDADVAHLTTRDLDPYVKIARSGRTGRVQVILSSALKQGY